MLCIFPSCQVLLTNVANYYCIWTLHGLFIWLSGRVYLCCSVLPMGTHTPWAFTWKLSYEPYLITPVSPPWTQPCLGWSWRVIEVRGLHNEIFVSLKPWEHMSYVEMIGLERCISRQELSNCLLKHRSCVENFSPLVLHPLNWLRPSDFPLWNMLNCLFKILICTSSLNDISIFCRHTGQFSHILFFFLTTSNTMPVHTEFLILLLYSKRLICESFGCILWSSRWIFRYFCVPVAWMFMFLRLSLFYVWI